VRIGITGAGGQLGRELEELCGSTGCDLLAWTRLVLDVTDQEAVSRCVEETRPDVIVHCAAYTTVDDCERDAERAFRINAIGTENVARAARRVGAKLVYISTDYVFDGRKGAAYKETDTPNPINVYGASKLEGERRASQCHDRLFIVRTSWLYGIHGPNFVKTMISLAREGRPIRVVADQVGSPTWCRDLAEAILKLVSTDAFGVYHISGSGQCSWYSFAREILARAAPGVHVEPISSEESGRLASRPAFSVLDNSRWVELSNSPLPDWLESLSRYLAMSS